MLNKIYLAVKKLFTNFFKVDPNVYKTANKGTNKEVLDAYLHQMACTRRDHALIIATAVSMMYTVPAVHLSKLQPLQNSAVRLITHTPRHCHITPVLLALHWLPLKFRICDKIAVISFKAIHNLWQLISYILNDVLAITWGVMWALFWKTLLLSSNALLRTDHLLQLLQSMERFTGLH